MTRSHLFVTLAATLLGVACGTTRSNQNARRNEAADEARALAMGTTRAPASTVSNDCTASAVYFDQGSADLDDQDRASLQTLASCLRRRDVNTLYVVGRTDPVGTPGYNLDLGRRRASAVASYLHSIGVDTDFVVKSRGESGATDDSVLWPYERSAATATAR